MFFLFLLRTLRPKDANAAASPHPLAKTERGKSWLLTATLSALLSPTAVQFELFSEPLFSRLSTGKPNTPHRLHSHGTKHLLRQWKPWALLWAFCCLYPSCPRFSRSTESSSVHRDWLHQVYSLFTSSVTLQTSPFQIPVSCGNQHTWEHCCPLDVSTGTPRHFQSAAGTVRTTTPKDYFTDILDYARFRKVTAFTKLFKISRGI